MKRKPICSNKHFKRLLESFNKISTAQVDRNEHLIKHHYDMLNDFFNHPITIQSDSVFELMLLTLNEKFKQNPYKTKSGYDWVYPTDGFILDNYKFWVSYTIEDENGCRIKKDSFKDKFIVFKIHMQVDNHKKRRISKWSVPITWH